MLTFDEMIAAARLQANREAATWAKRNRRTTRRDHMCTTADGSNGKCIYCGRWCDYRPLPTN